jgi:hypothetical protein
MTKPDSIERRNSGVPAGAGTVNGTGGPITTKVKLQLIFTAVISLLIGISVGILAVHLLSGTAPGLAGHWRQYARF